MMDMEKQMPEKKSERTTEEQLQFYVEFCRKHPEWQSGKNTPSQPRRMKAFWDDLASQLNAMRGPTRTATRWKESLSNWKKQVRSRARKAKADMKRTVGGPKAMDVTEFEQQALDVLGASAIDGLPGMISLGVEDAVAGTSTIIGNSSNASEVQANSNETVSSDTVEEEEMRDDANIANIIPATPSPHSSSSSNIANIIPATPSLHSSSTSNLRTSSARSTDDLLHVLLESIKKRDEREERALEQQRMLSEAILKLTEVLQKINNV